MLTLINTFSSKKKKKNNCGRMFEVEYNITKKKKGKGKENMTWL
jgi:hypothetical protein